MKKERVVVAMSGGVESLLAAALLLEQGYDVVGMTMRLSEETRAVVPNAPSSVDDARRVADVLGIPHYVIDFTDVFERTSTISLMNIFAGVRPTRALSAIVTLNSMGFSARRRTSMRPVLRRGIMRVLTVMRTVFIICARGWITIRISPMCSTI